MNGYTVVVTREDDLWVAVAIAPDGATLGALDFTDFGEAHETMPAFIADMTNADPESVVATWRYEINGKDVTEQLERLQAVEAQLRRVQQEQERARRDALAALSDAGVSQRIMANVMHLSHQRIHQLVHG